MKNSVVLTLLFFTVFSALAQTATINGIYDYDKAKSIVKSINKERQKQGLKTLKMERALTEAAMLRTAEFAYQWSRDDKLTDDMKEHIRPNGSSFQTAILERYPEPARLYECLLSMYSTPFGIDVLQDLFSSGTELGQWEAIGVGVFHANRRTFCVVLLLSKGDGVSGIPSGMFDTKVQLGTSSGKKSAIIAQKETSEEISMRDSITLTGTYCYDFASEVVTLVNEQRKKYGSPPLAMDSTFTECAMMRAAEIAAHSQIPFSSVEINTRTGMKNFGEGDAKIYTHTRPNGLRPVTILSYTPEKFGENLAFGQETPENAMDGWMNSPGHRENLLKKTYSVIGVGCFTKDNTFYWVQLFAGGKSANDYKPNHREEVSVLISLSPEVETKTESKKRK